MKHVYIDCEFLVNDFSPRGLISIGITTQEASYYAVNADMDEEAVRSSEWLTRNVWHYLPREEPDTIEVTIGSPLTGPLDASHPDVRPYPVIRDEVGEFFRAACAPHGDSRDGLRMFANCGAQDMVRLHSLWGNDWGKMPRQIPRYFDDMERVILDSGIPESEFPVQPFRREHHSLSDAEHEMGVHAFILERQQQDRR